VLCMFMCWERCVGGWVGDLDGWAQDRALCGVCGILSRLCGEWVSTWPAIALDCLLARSPAPSPLNTYRPKDRRAGAARARGEELEVDRLGLARPAQRLGGVHGHERADARPYAWSKGREVMVGGWVGVREEKGWGQMFRSVGQSVSRLTISPPARQARACVPVEMSMGTPAFWASS
jgi:hypothetical protein